MSNDTAKQTLFRFVSLRNPQLTETKHRNLGFIFRPDGVIGYFDNVINTKESTKTKIETLELSIPNFDGELINSVKELEEGEFSQLIKIGRKISKGLELTTIEVNDVKNYYATLHNDEKQLTENGIVTLKKMWDNLIYQTITQKKFYIKEAIIQILRAIHVGFSQYLLHDDEFLEINGTDYLNKAINAKIILPPYLFLEDYEQEENTRSKTKKTLGSEEVILRPLLSKARIPNTFENNQILVSSALDFKEKIESLLKDLSKVEQRYRKEYFKELEIAQNNYKQQATPEYEAYRDNLLQLEASFNETTTDAQRKLAISRIPKPNVQDFDFTFRKEINTLDLSEGLSSESLRTFVNVLDVQKSPIQSKMASNENTLLVDNISAVLPEDNLSTFDEVKTALTEKLKLIEDLIYKNSIDSKEESISLGGFILPLNNEAFSGISNTNITFDCTLTTTLSGFSSLGTQFKEIANIVDPSDGGGTEANYNFNLSINQTNTDYKVIAIEYSVNDIYGGTFNGYEYTEGTPIGSKHFYNHLFGEGFPLSTFEGLNSFSATVFFENGKKGTLTFNPSTGFFGLKSSYDCTLIIEDNENGDTTLLPLSYKLCSKAVSQGLHNLDLTLEMPYENWQVTGLLYKFKYNNEIIENNFYSSETDYSDLKKIILKNLFNQGIEDYKFSGSSLDVEVKFSNNKKLLFTIPSILLDSCINGNFVILDDTPVIPVHQDQPSIKNFMPKGFGMRRLGIADYLKVEQSLHGYVEGEVAHIENVMARERREKSTKKTSRSEITTMESYDSEKEQQRDTTSTERFEMQNEVSKVMQETKDKNISAHVDGSFAGVSFGVAGSYATHTAKDESIKQAVTQAKEITSKATDRITTKVHRERTEKMIEEFEENNLHEFDNRKGDKHYVGVYRWVDKIYKNQIYDFGKRMMFEFMIPEPAKLHQLGKLISDKKTDKILVKPKDPREEGLNQLNDYTDISLDKPSVRHWLKEYNIKLENLLENKITVGASMKMKYEGKSVGAYEGNSEKMDVEIPLGYKVKKAIGNVYASKDNDASVFSGVNVSLGSKNYLIIPKQHSQAVYSSSGWWIFSTTHVNIIYYTDGNVQMVFQNTDETNYTTTFPVSYTLSNFFDGNLNIELECELTPEGKIQEQQRIFNLIIEGYEKSLAKYEQKVAEEQAKGVRIAGENPMFYRQIENTILKRNCISYMISQDIKYELALGKNHYYTQPTNVAESFTNTEVSLTKKLDDYAELVKFMEQAFEWNIMSYYFYPYYWANRENWSTMYQNDESDATFRAFLQSGMARVVVTVRPGFEDAVQFYLTTGKIWNGGEVPVIGDPLYLSLADEIREPKGKKYGKAWATRVPTALTILQAQSIGLNVNKALPFNNDTSDFEDPTSVPHTSSFNFSSALIGQGDAETKKIQFLFKDMDGWLQKIGDFDQEQLFPRVYECMGETIEVDRDAGWETEQSSVVIFEELANKLNAIDGVQAIALPEGEQGISFVVDTSKIKTFDFRKPGGVDAFDYLKLSTDGKTFVKLLYPDNSGGYGSERILDRLGNSIKGNEVGKELNINRFLV